MSEPITNVEDAVAALGALPVPQGPEPRTPKPIAYARKITNADLLLAHPSEKQRAAEWPWDMWCRICLIRPTSHRTEAQALEAADQHVKLYHAPQDEVHKLMAAGGLAEFERLRARVAELERERHSTNEALDDAAKALREQRDRIAELDAQLLTLNTQRGDVAELIERERAEGEECVDIDALESALGLCSDGDPSQAPHDDEEGCDHPNGYGPNGCAGCGAFRPADGEDDVRPQVRKLRALLAGQRAQAGGAS